MKWFIIIGILISISIPSAFADYRGETFLDRDNGDGSHTLITGLSPWIDSGMLDSEGRKKFAHYIIDDQPTYVKVTNGEASFVFDKNTCSAKIYDGGLITDSNGFILGSDSYVPKSSVDGSGTWSIVTSVNNAQCVTEITETENSIEVSGTKQSSAGIFKVRYLKEEGKPLKTILEATNLTTLTDRRFGVTQTQSIPQIITWAGEQRNLANFVGQTFDRTWLENNKANLSNLFIYNGLQFDVIDAWDHLESITVNSVSNGMASISFNYLRNAPILMPNEKLIIDPTYSQTATTSGTVLDNTAGDVCSVGTTTDTANLEIIKYATGGANDCKFAYFDFDTSTIPDDATITDSVFKYEINAVADPLNADVRSMGSTRASDTAANIFAAILSGTTLVSNSAAFSTVATNISLDLGTTADAEIQSKLASDFYTFGVRHTNLTMDGTTYQNYMLKAGTPPPTLEVTYSVIPTPDSITDLTADSVGITTASLSFTPPNLNGETLINYMLNVTTPQQDTPPSTFWMNGSASPFSVVGLTGATDYSASASAYTAGGGNWTLANVLNFTTSIVPDGILSITTGNVGDTIKVESSMNVTQSIPLPANVTALKLYKDNSLVKTDSIFVSISTLNNDTSLDNFWYQITDGSSHDYALVATLENTAGTVDIVSSTNATIIREYDPSYLPAVDNPSIQGSVNATIERFDSQDGLLLKVNRIGVSTGETWQIECIAQTNSEAAQTKNQSATWSGDWQNTTNTGYFNTTYTGFANSHAYVTCFNEDELFTMTSFTNSSLALLGIQLFDDSYGAMLGVPVGVFFLVMTAGMANKRTAPTFIIVITGIAGTMATIGFFSFDPLVWGLALVTAMLGIFVNQKIF